MKRYLYRVCLSLSILVNVILLGEMHQTFSARNYQRSKDKKRNICFVIDRVLGSDHCLVCWSRWVVTR